jgi:hypothetical protein
VFVVEIKDESAQSHDEEDGSGGIRHHYAIEKKVLAGDWIWLKVTVSPRSDWSGYIEVQGATSDGRRAFARQRAIVETYPIDRPRTM